ncbi:hypothetical protein Poli38472_014932 [Pythium oligandrum]|uniref:ABC transporter domain-containing protein n=1 Tax=Pythium oligandrum TaxID=41045 RepID=A0A8K1FBU6_PYTOL|nr:hypothetical protein Poli38472_014932 [Pythium oligandrum]|eukprot:TMW57645.1 hypothetical protein Poli38472_014932 [Pythium oligandrum]
MPNMSPTTVTSYVKNEPMTVKHLGHTEHPRILSWSDLSYTVNTKRTDKFPGGKKKILRSVSGRCCPGELTAVMGPSGCGKTTLLDILADRIHTGEIDGEIEVNGVKREEKSFRAITSYVSKKTRSFTVSRRSRSAMISLPRSVTRGMIKQRVQGVIDEMGLRVCEHTLIGDLFRKGISGGQKRRLSIAIELLSNPILLLDEPTSGLDSSSTYNVMKFIVKLCEEGKTVISTCNFIASLPGIFLIALISSVLVVFLADLNSFGWFLLNLFLSLVVAESMMHVIGAAVPHYIIGIALGAGIFGMFMLCEGFMVPRESIPDYWIWGYYMAFHTYSFESFVYKHFAYENTATAQAILVRLGMEHVDVPRNMAILAGYAVGFELLFTFILYKFHTGRR